MLHYTAKLQLVVCNTTDGVEVSHRLTSDAVVSNLQGSLLGVFFCLQSELVYIISSEFCTSYNIKK